MRINRNRQGSTLSVLRMTTDVNKCTRCSIAVLVCCVSICLYTTYYLLFNMSGYKYWCHLTLHKSLDENHTEFASSNAYRTLSNRSMIRHRSTLTLNNFLNATHPELVSLNGRFILRLESTGELRYIQILEFPEIVGFENSNKLSKRQSLEKSLFSTSTGDSWPGQHIVDLTSKGVLRVRVNAKLLKDWKTTWTSSILAQCKKSTVSNISPVLSIEDSGLLAIYSNPESFEKLCILHPEVIYRSHSGSGPIITSSKGKSPRLAVVIAGLFRSNEKTCRSHVDKIINKWQQTHSGLVDVFIFTYIQSAALSGGVPVNEQSITTALQKCYKENLKSFRVKNLGEVEESFQGIAAAEIKQCGPKLNRLQSQLKTVYLAGQLMRNYMLSEGISYDYILRLRPDTDLWGNIPDLPIFGVFDNEARVFLPHPFREHYYWCTHHDGRVRTGVTDQLAYGTLPAMQTYLNMYLEFSEMVRVTTGHYTPTWKKAKYDMRACEGTVGEDGCDNPNGDNCAIECLVSYYLVLHGLEPEILWSWQQNVLTSGGSHHKDCGQPYNC